MTKGAKEQESMTQGVRGVTAAGLIILLLLCVTTGFAQIHNCPAQNNKKIGILYSENSRTWFGLKFPDCATTGNAGVEAAGDYAPASRCCRARGSSP